MTRFLFPMTAALLAVACAPIQTTQPVQPDASQSPSQAPSPGATSAPAATALSGTIYDDADGAVAGAKVEAWLDGQLVQTAESAADGRYTLGLTPGAYRVSASKAGLTRREQSVAVNGATTLNFGGWADALINPFHLARHPEISGVEVKEQAPGGPLALTIQFSEPIAEVGRTNLLSRLELRARNNEVFLRPTDTTYPELETQAEWAESGKSLTLRYDQPYLASGDQAALYTLRLTQFEKDSKDPVTRENEWEDMRVTDEEGLPLGRNRADFAFLKPELTAFPASLLADKTYGYSPEIRRWNLTHTSSFAFNAAQDTTGPGVTSVRVDVNKLLGAAASDVMTLRFTEPMRVVKNREERQYTRLDEDRALRDTFVVNVSKYEDGRNPEPLAPVYKISRFRFSKTEPNVVYAHFPSQAFREMKWVEVTLGDEARDPAGNKPAGEALTVSGEVTSTEE